MKLYKNKLKVSYAKITILIFVFMSQGFNILNPLQAQSQENPTTESILDSVIFQNNLLSPFSASYTKTMTWERPEGSGVSITECISHWDGSKSDYISNDYKLIDNEKVPTNSIRVIWDGKQELRKQVSIAPSQEQYINIVGISKKANDFMFQKRSFGTYLYSYGRSEEGFVDLLRNSSDLIVKEQKEKIDDHECYVLEGTTEKGHVRVWIDPNTGFNIRKIIINKKEDTNISEVVIDDIQIQQVEDIWLPMSVSSNMVTKDSEGNILNEVKTTYKRTQIEFNPDFEKLGAFKMGNIPNGTPIKDFDYRGLLYEWQNGKIVPINIEPVSLLGKPLPNLKDIGIDPLPIDVNNKSMLVCFFDIQQRPSRNCILQLSKREQELKEKDVEIVAVQASKVEQEKLDEWIKENDIDFSVGIIEGDSEKTRFNWGVNSLPWLILTDKEHVVIAEGFNIDELDEKNNRNR
ncbi:MAG: hypothetical protein JW715_08360 [Sedimentisphaerales bacterium]|nr:hypothetical protein [Sedimentisphaerales bacterium]